MGILRAYPAVIELTWRRAAVVIAYAEVAVAAGWADRAIRHLRALAVREPLNEKAYALLVDALTVTGQRAVALELFEGMRRRLAAELGISPGPELVGAHLRALREPEVVTPPAGDESAARPVPGGQPSRPVPRQLPPLAPYFAGRADELAALTAMMGQGTGAGGTVVISAIDGTAGVGKTALAVQWAHQVADRFQDGQLYVDLRGFGPVGPPLDPTEALRQLLEDLGVSADRIPLNLDGRIGMYRKLLAGRRIVVVLDNARDPAQVRPLLPRNAECLAVVTSRHQLTGLAVADSAHLLTLDLLSQEDAHELLVRRLGGRRISAEPDAAVEVIRLCARLPLSLSIAAARAAARPELPLAALAAELCDTQARLDELSTGDITTDLRAVFSWSCQQVSGSAARMFWLIGVHPGPDLSAHAAASLAGIQLGHARQALAELARAHLVAEPVPGRYSCHDLLRTYAAEQSLIHETPDSRRAALHRLLDHYLHTAFTASRLLHQYRDLITLEAPVTQVEPEQIADRQRALEWFEAEQHVLLASIESAARDAFDLHAWQLPWTVATFLSWQGHWQKLELTQRTALAAARRLGDQTAQALAHHYLGQAQFRLGTPEAARSHQNQALRLGRQLGSSIIQARALIELARSFDREGRRGDALTHVKQSLPYFRAAGCLPGEADALNAAAWCHAQLGDHVHALDYCEQALAAQRELQNHPGEAAALDSLGYIHYQLGHHGEAIACYQEALEVHGDTDMGERAVMLVHLGDAHHAAGEADRARTAWHEALAILADLHDPNAEAVRQKLGNGGEPRDPR